MNRTLLESEEGTHTVMCDVAGETFQSLTGPLKESMHVFIHNGLMKCSLINKNLSILKIGFGSGLNALLSMKYLDSINGMAEYTATELYPLEMNLVSQINYFNYIDRKYRNAYFNLHTSAWNEWIDLEPLRFKKIQCDCSKTVPEGPFNLIYFDAFSAEADPAIWTEAVFSLIYDQLNDNGVLIIKSTNQELINQLIKIGYNTEVSKDTDLNIEFLVASKLGTNPVIL